MPSAWRNSSLPANAYESTDEMFEEFAGAFEPPRKTRRA